MKGVFRIAAYRRLLAAYALNQLAFMVGSLALTVLVYARTGSAVAAAGFFLCAEFAPSPLSPWLVGRLSAHGGRQTLAVLAGAEAVVFTVIAVLTRHFSLPAVLLLALVDGVLALAGRTLARTATAAVLMREDLLREGNAVTNGAFTVSMMVAPAVGGVVVASGGIRATMLAVAAAFAVIAGVLIERRPTLAPGDAASAAPSSRVREALRHLRTEPQLMRMLLLQGAATLCFTVPMPVEIVFVHKSLHDGSSAYGLLLAVWGSGAVAGSVLYARFRRASGRAMVCAGTGALAAGFIVIAAAPGIAVAAAGAAVCGIGNGVVAVSLRTTLQERIAERWLGMMMSLSESVNQATPGAGIVVGGVLAAVAGPRAALAVAGGGAACIVLAAWRLLAPGRATDGGASGPRGEADALAAACDAARAAAHVTGQAPDA